MRRALILVAAIPASIAASLWFLAASPWSPTQLIALALVALSAAPSVGRLGASLLVIGLLAFLGSDGDGESALVSVFLPIVATIAIGGVLACAVLRTPSLGRRIEHGPLGPGL